MCTCAIYWGIVLEQLQNSELDNDKEIDQLKQFFIKLDHHIDRLRA